MTVFICDKCGQDQTEYETNNVLVAPATTDFNQHVNYPAEYEQRCYKCGETLSVAKQCPLCSEIFHPEDTHICKQPCHVCGMNENTAAIGNTRICAECLTRQYANQYLSAMKEYFPEKQDIAESMAIWCSLLLLNDKREK